MAGRFLIVPGLNGSPEGHWQHHWLADHDNAVLVDQADWANPDAAAWMANLEAAIAAHPHSIIIAHSLGSILTARLAGSRLASKVAGALLVAPADIERTEVLKGKLYRFGILPTGRLPFPSRVVASRDDIYMNFAKAKLLAGTWGSELVDLGYAGHINIASGYGRWAEGYRLAQELGALALN